MITTTSQFAAGIVDDPLLGPHVPYRVELKDGPALRHGLKGSRTRSRSARGLICFASGAIRVRRLHSDDMRPATHTNILWFRLGTSLRNVNPAPLLADDMADLTDYWRGLLRKSPDFDSTVELEGFAPVVVRYRSLCQTVAMIDFPPHTAKDKLPDALCLMVNGLEAPQDIAAVKAKVKFPPPVWEALHKARKPVVIATFNQNGRMRDPATVTVIHVVANVYFNTFGTNSVGSAPRI
ncbi:MAG: hypothetical protein ACAI43_16240 [Phycisphaerae bacterium]|nr:hypothetical protein [Tepidisphaeraceae bacterium]